MKVCKKIVFKLNSMKRIILFLFCVLIGSSVALAQRNEGCAMNNNGDNIIGEYLTDRGGSKSKVRVQKAKNGTYMARVFWVEKPLDKNGNKRKDVKNPDENLRNVDIDNVLLVKGLKYDAEDKEWGDAKIYDPSKGIRVNVTAEFVSDNKLKLRGTILGIGTTIYWTKIK